MPSYLLSCLVTQLTGEELDPTLLGSQLTYGVVFAESFCGNSAESSRKTMFNCARKGCGNSAESLRKFAENFLQWPLPERPHKWIVDLLGSQWFVWPHVWVLRHWGRFPWWGGLWTPRYHGPLGWLSKRRQGGPWAPPPCSVNYLWELVDVCDRLSFLVLQVIVCY